MASPYLRVDLRGGSAYGAPQLDVPVRLNTNENPFPPPAEVMESVAEAVGAAHLNRYPDREASEMRAALAGYAGHVPEGTWAANGSNEVLQQICQAFGGPGACAMTFEPSYAMHPLIARVTGMRTVSVPRRSEDFSVDLPAALAAIQSREPAIVFVTSPNNPTGNATSAEVVAELCAAATGVVVVDEAYREFGSSTSQGLLEERANLIITRTMSKAFALAGVRVGYCLTSEELVEDLHLVRLPYHLSALTQAAAVAALSHAEACLAQVAVLIGERDRVIGALGAMGVEVLPSEANFFCFAILRPPAETWRALLDKGVLVRDVSGWGDLGRFLRACVGTPEENDAFLVAMKEVLDA